MWDMSGWHMASISASKLFTENCLFLHVQAFDEDSEATIVYGFEKRGYFLVKIDFQLVALKQSTVNDLSVALCCASKAAPIPEKW